MNPFVAALLFLLREKHASGNHPDGEAQRHIDAIEDEVAIIRSETSRSPLVTPLVAAQIAADLELHGTTLPAGNRPAPAPGDNWVIKHYPCGCSAGPGLVDMPDYCSEHGSPDDTLNCVSEPAE